MTSAIHPGDVLRHLRIEKLIAQGRASATFRGTDLRTNSPVAIEIPHPEIEADPVFYERLQRDEPLSNTLDHPGLVRLIEKHAGPRGEGRSCIVREWFDGESLRDVIARGKLAPERAISIAAAICEVAEYLHGKGIVCLDIQPEHILVGPAGQVKLIHAGVSSKTGARRLTFTKLSQLVGASQYVSPEELRGHRAGPGSDVYSIGVMLYEMLTGRLPFESAQVEARLASWPVPPRVIDPSISPQLQEVIYRALEREPGNRYASAQALARDLRHLDQVGVSDRLELKEWKSSRSSRRKKVLLYAAIGLAPLVIFVWMLFLASRQ